MTFPSLGMLGPIAMFGHNGGPPIDMGSGSEYAATANATSYTFSHTVAAGTTVLVVFASAPVNSTGRTITSVTFGGVALTQGAGINYTAGGRQAMVYAYYLLNPSVSTADVVTTYSSTTSSFSGWAKNFSNVDQTTPIAASATDNHATGLDLSPNISPSVPSVLLGIHMRYGTSVATFTASADATSISTQTATGDNPSRHDRLMKSQPAGGTYDFGSTASAAATISAFCSIALAGAG